MSWQPACLVLSLSSSTLLLHWDITPQFLALVASSLLGVSGASCTCLPAAAFSLIFGLPSNRGCRRSVCGLVLYLLLLFCVRPCTWATALMPAWVRHDVQSFYVLFMLGMPLLSDSRGCFNQNPACENLNKIVLRVSPGGLPSCLWS